MRIYTAYATYATHSQVVSDNSQLVGLVQGIGLIVTRCAAINPGASPYLPA
jgi:hypothetical protein